MNLLFSDIVILESWLSHFRWDGLKVFYSDPHGKCKFARFNRGNSVTDRVATRGEGGGYFRLGGGGPRNFLGCCLCVVCVLFVCCLYCPGINKYVLENICFMLFAYLLVMEGRRVRSCCRVPENY